MHSTVNITRLKQYVDGAQQFPSREVEVWGPDGQVVLDDNGAKEWEVEEVLAQRGTGSRRQYLVKWKGWPLWEATWEKESNLENAQESLDEFREKVAGNDAIQLNFLDKGRFREVENVTDGALDGHEVHSGAVGQSRDTVSQPACAVEK
jgi:hypothetical protein